MPTERSSQRYDAELDVDLAMEGDWAKARTRNISLGGLYLVTQLRLETGKKVRIRLTLPGGGKIESDVIIRWLDAGGAGVQFDGLRAKDVWALGKFLEAR